MLPKNISVLLLDDEADFLEELLEWLQFKGYCAEGYVHADAALEAIRLKAPSIVFLDIVMPEKDGLQVLREIRQMDAQLPVVMLTAHSSPQRIEAAEKLGIMGYLLKEDDAKKTAEMVERALQTFLKLE